MTEKAKVEMVTVPVRVPKLVLNFLKDYTEDAVELCLSELGKAKDLDEAENRVQEIWVSSRNRRWSTSKRCCGCLTKGKTLNPPLFLCGFSMSLND